MKLYMKQKVFSWTDQFRIYDEYGNDVYSVAGEFFSLGKKLHLYNNDGMEICFIYQKLLSFLPRFYIEKDGADIAEVVKKFTLFKPEYMVHGPEWQVRGDFWEHDYTIEGSRGNVAYITKKWLTWGDTYEIDISNDADAILALSTVLIIDAILEQEQAATASSN